MSRFALFALAVLSPLSVAAPFELKCSGPLPLGDISIEGSLTIGAKQTSSNDSSSVGDRKLLSTQFTYPLSGELRITLTGEDGANIRPANEKLVVKGSVYRHEIKFKDNGDPHYKTRGFTINANPAKFPLEKVVAISNRAEKGEITEKERIRATREIFDKEYNPGQLFSKFFGLWNVKRLETEVYEDGKKRDHFEQEMTLRHRYTLFGTTELPIKCTTSELPL